MLKFSVDLYRRWRKDDAIQNGVRSYRFQHGDVEDGVDRSHSIGEMECKGVRAGLSNNFERSEELLRQLPGGSGHAEILRLNIDKVSDLELWCRSPTGVRWTLIVTLRIGNLGMEFLVEFVQVYSEFSSMS